MVMTTTVIDSSEVPALDVRDRADDPTTETPSPTYPGRWLGLFGILAASLMNLLDSTVGNVAAPAIRADLGGSLSTLQWIAAGYTLALAVGLLTGGRLGDMFGRKRMLMLSVAGFVAASAACAFAGSPETLIAARVVQGAFGAVMLPQCFGLMRDLFGAEVGKAFAVLGPVIGLSIIAGPIVAGLLIDANVFGSDWRSIFWLNVPLGAFSLYVSHKVLPDGGPADRTQRLDLVGAVVAAAGMFLLVYPLVQGRELGWPAWSLGMLAASVPTLVGFGWQQARRQGGGRTPLVELSVFAKRSYTSGVLFVIVFFGAIVGFSLAIGLFLQLGLHYSPLDAAVAMAAWPVGAFVGSVFGSTMMNKLGRHILHIGLTVMAVGLVHLYTVFEGDGSGFSAWDLTVPLLAYGAGMGMIFVPLFDIIVGRLEDHEVGSASGLLESFQQLGASLGIAVLGTVFFGAVDTGIDVESFVGAARQVTLLTVGLTVAAFAMAFLLPKRARAHA
jgi:EmrB/QacA subfamily drug resistance transporter